MIEFINEDETFYLINIDNEKVGNIEFDEWSHITEKNIQIHNIEIDSKNKGYGSQVVDYLKSQYNEIHGESVPDPSAINFWIKRGAKFDEELFQEWIENDSEDLIPFKIRGSN